MNAVRLNLGFALTCSSLLDAWLVVILSVLWNVRVGTQSMPGGYDPFTLELAVHGGKDRGSGFMSFRE